MAKAKNILEGVASMMEKAARKPKKAPAKSPMMDDSAQDGKPEPDADDLIPSKKPNPFKKKGF